MRTFEQYLNESKNTHLTHIEDLLLLVGPEGADRAINFLDSIVRMLAPELAEAKITLKWDGAPAIIAGIDPATNKFFVGTKSVFAKNSKVNFTNADIDRNHGGSGDLPKKLKIALRDLPKIWKKGVFQGDLMFTKADLKKIKIGGETSVAFRPNTITYAAPVDSELGKRIRAADMGIIFHTRYTGKTIPEMKASFNVSISDFKPNSKVWFDDAEFKDVSQGATFSPKEATDVLSVINSLKPKVSSVKSALARMFKNKEHLDALIIFNNAKIREGAGITHVANHFADFVNWYSERQYSKYKTWTEEKDNQLRKVLMDARNDYITALEFYQEIREIKKIIITKLNTIKNMRTFLQTDTGFKVVGHEGFVAITNDGSSVKLVDRMEFSRNNFTTDKNWVR